MFIFLIRFLFSFLTFTRRDVFYYDVKKGQSCFFIPSIFSSVLSLPLVNITSFKDDTSPNVLEVVGRPYEIEHVKELSESFSFSSMNSSRSDDLRDRFIRKNRSSDREILMSESPHNTFHLTSTNTPHNTTLFPCFTGDVNLQDRGKIKTQTTQRMVYINETFLTWGAQKDPPLILIFSMFEGPWNGFSNTSRVSEMIEVALQDTLISITEAFSAKREKISVAQRFKNESLVHVVEFCLISLDQTFSVTQSYSLKLVSLLHSYLESLNYKVPGISLLSTSSPLFAQISTAYQLFGCSLLTPRSFASQVSLETYPNVLSFSPLSVDQAYVLVDLCRFMRWHRVVLVGTLGTKSLHITAAFLRQATSRHITVHTLRGNFGVDTAHLNATCVAPPSEIEDMAKSLSESISLLDYSIFIFAVDALCFPHVLTALRLARLDVKQRIVLIFSDTASQLFPIARRYLYGTETSSMTQQSEVMEGWFFVLPGSPHSWCLGNMAIQHRLNRDKSASLPFSSTHSPITGFYEMLFYDILRVVAQQVILQSNAFIDIHCLPPVLFFEEMVKQRSDDYIEQQYMTMQHKIIHNQRTVYDPYCFIKPFHLTLENGSTVVPISRPNWNTPLHDWPRFSSLMGSIVISPRGTSTSRFGVFNIGRFSNHPSQMNHSSETLNAHVIAVWDKDEPFDNTTVLAHHNPLSRDLHFQGDTVWSRLYESVFFSSYDINGIRLYNHDYLQPVVNRLEGDVASRQLTQVQFPGSSTCVKDCLFCDKTRPSMSLLLCPICEEDRLQLHALLLYLIRRNPDLFNNRSYMKNTTLASYFPHTPRPTELSVCELWPLIIRCSSPLTYILYLEGLDLKGPLPNHIGRLKHMEELRLSRNYFDGPLPSFSPNLCRSGLPGLPYLMNVLRPSAIESMEVNKLRKVYLNRNLFNGTIPDDWKYCTSLGVLYLNDNQLDGSLPHSLCEIHSLTDVDISRNQFSEKLPLCLGSVKDPHTNFSGSTGWENLIHFNLEKNKFEGEIPFSFYGLSRLMTLKMGRNRFNGTLPDIWDAMPPGLLLDITQNPFLSAPLPSSLIRRVFFRPENIWIDPYLYECSRGHFAPVGSLAPNVSFVRSLDDSQVALLNLSSLCRPCPKGYVVTQDASGCIPCPAGTVAETEASSECVKCAAGTYSFKGQDHCLLCKPGTYNNVQGSPMCHPCPSNHYAEDFGSSFCLLCPKGANCSTTEQKAYPVAAMGWYRTDQKRVTSTLLFSKGINSNETSLRVLLEERDFRVNPKTSPSINLDYFGQPLNEKELQKRLGLYECPKPSHCLGNNICLHLSFGPYCHQCHVGYRIVPWRGTCQPCPAGFFPWLRFLTVVSLALMCVVYIFYLLRSTGQKAILKRGKDPLVKMYPNKLVVRMNQHHAVVFKVLTSWVELNGQALSYAIQAALQNDGQTGATVSSYVELVYDFIQNLDDPFFLLFPLECWLPSWAPNSLHCSLLVALFSPIFFFFLIATWQYRKCLITSILNWFHGMIKDEGTEYRKSLRHPVSVDTTYKPPASFHGKSSSCVSDVKNSDDDLQSTTQEGEFFDPWANTVGIFTVLFFLIHPAITRQFLKNLDCVQVDVPRVKQNYSLVCTRSPHQHYIVLAWIGLSGWTFGLPLLFVFKLHHLRYRLQSPKVLAQWGFLLDGYESRYYWWEIWAMLRKVLLDIPPVVPFLTDHLQHLCMLCLAIVCLVAHVSAEPFDNRFYKVADHMETYNLWTFLLTLLTVPVHQALNDASGHMKYQTLSKLCLSVTFLASGTFVIWCFLFFLRPFLQSYFDRYPRNHSHRLMSRRPPLLKNPPGAPAHGTVWRFAPRPVSTNSLTATHNAPAQSAILLCLEPFETSPGKNILSPMTQEEKEDGVEDVLSPSVLMVLGKTSIYQAFHQVIHHCLNTTLGRTVLRFHSGKVYLTFPGHTLDLSELNSTEKKFFRDVILMELIDAQFRVHPDFLDSHFVCSSLFRIFRLKAFALKTTQTKLAVCRVAEIHPRNSFSSWSRSVSKEGFRYLKSALHHTVKPFGLVRLFSLNQGTSQVSLGSFKGKDCGRQLSCHFPLGGGTHDIKNAPRPFLCFQKSLSSVNPDSVPQVKPLCAFLSEPSESEFYGKNSTGRLRRDGERESPSCERISPGFPLTAALDPTAMSCMERKQDSYSTRQRYGTRWKKATRKIVWSLAFYRALERFPEAFTEESSQYGWTVEELQESVYHMMQFFISREYDHH